MIDVLCYHLLKEESQPKFLPAFLKNKTRLQRVADMNNVSDRDNAILWKVLELICLFHTEFNRLPGAKSLSDYYRNNGAKLGIDGAWATQLKHALGELKEFDPVRLKVATDPDVIIQNVVKDARIDWIRNICQTAAFIAVNDADMANRNKVDYGPDAAKAYIFKALSRDVSSDDAISGSLKENAEKIVEHLRELYNTDIDDRMRLGFTELDDNFLVGKRFNRLIHILGFSNEGKSLLTRTFAYNIALKGHKTLYVGLEDDAINSLAKFAFLYGSVRHGKECPLKPHESCIFTMPSYESWQMQQCTTEDMEHVMWCLKMLRDHHDIPLYVYDRRTMSTWEQIEAAVEADNYECVVVDYIPALDLPGVKDKDRDFAVTALFDKAYQLCTRKGTVVISPLQTNREGKKQADNKDPHQEKIYSMVHVSKYSRAYENCDLMFAVYSSPEMKATGEIKIETLKVRTGNYPESGEAGGIFADVDTGTKHVTELVGKARYTGKEFAKTFDKAMEEAQMQHADDAVVDREMM